MAADPTNKGDRAGLVNFSQHRVQHLQDFLFATRSTLSLRTHYVGRKVRRMIVNAPRLLAIVVVQWIVPSAAADTSDCRDALQRHRTAHAEVVAASKDYARCVLSNDLHEDCSPEFATLRSAHDKFEAAVANVESGCS